MTHRPFQGLIFIAISILMLGCGFVGFVQNPTTFNGVAYWAAQTSTPIPTVTQFLGMSTPVYVDTPIPQQIILLLQGFPSYHYLLFWCCA